MTNNAFENFLAARRESLSRQSLKKKWTWRAAFR